MTKARPVTITVASIIFIVYGIVTIVTSILLGTLISISSYQYEPVPVLFALVIFIIALIGLLDIIAGYGLWHMNRWAAIMGMLLSIFGIMGQSLIYGSLGYSGSISGMVFAGHAIAGGGRGNALVLFLFAITWGTFEPLES